MNDYGYYTLRKWDPIFWFALVKLLKFIAFLVDIVLINLVGTSILNGSNEERKRSKEYEHSAHVVNVISRGTIALVANHDESNFFYVHDQYVHPNFILEHDNIVLKGSNTKHAIFCVSRKGICTLDSSIGPFAWVNTFIAAEKLIFLPLNHFHHLAEESGNPLMNNLKVTIIHMTARCGSTLLGRRMRIIFGFSIFSHNLNANSDILKQNITLFLGQMFETIPKMRVMQEPYSFLHAWNLYLKGKVSLVEYEKILDSTFRLQCKRENGINHILIKLNMSATPTLSYIKRRYPETTLLFNTRHPLPSLKSYGKLWNILPVSGTIAILLNINGFGTDNYPIHYDDIVWWERYRALVDEGSTLDKQIALMRFFFFSYWCVVEQYIKNKNLYHKVIFYEDLCERPATVIEDLFSSLNLPHGHVQDALSAMKSDSQKGMFGNMGTYANEDLSSTIASLDRKFTECNLPISMNITMENFRNMVV